MNYELGIKKMRQTLANVVRRVFIIHNPSAGWRVPIQNRSGFTLLLAVVLSSLLLSIGVAIFNSTFKGFELSSIGRDSQFAFYAADSGLECALYWDIRGGAFATSTESDTPSSGVLCADQDIAESWDVVKLSSSAETSFTISFLPEGFCAIVVVLKTDNEGTIETVIESRGYNTCDVSSKRRVERAIRMSYD